MQSHPIPSDQSAAPIPAEGPAIAGQSGVTTLVATALEGAAPEVASRRPWGRSFLHHLQVLLGFIVGLSAVAWGDADRVLIAAAVLALWAVVLTLRPVANVPGLHSARRVAETSGQAFAVAAATAAVGLIPLPALVPILTAVFLGAVTASALCGLQWLRRRPARALIVGDPIAVAVHETAWRSRPGVQILACHARRSGMQPDAGLRTIVDTLRIDTVIVVPGPGFSAGDLQSLSWELEQTDVSIVIAGVVDRLAPHRLRAGRFGGTPVVAVAPTPRSWLHRSGKAAMDRVVATLLLVLLAPVMAALAVVIRLDSAGPALFKQRRVGQAGRLFLMYKFRTMTSDPVEIVLPVQRTAGNDVLFKMRDDPRVTRVGRVLRRLSLDELPQLINVVRGEMSLIGPRPALWEETAKYDLQAWRRAAVKPGITGLWQVSGRSDLTWEQSIALDVHYVDNWRATDDLTIAARTLWAVVRKKGAY